MRVTAKQRPPLLGSTSVPARAPGRVGRHVAIGAVDAVKRRDALLLTVSGALGGVVSGVLPASAASISLFDFEAERDGQMESFAQFKGKTLIIMNRLRTLYDKYSQYGFELVAFPCNQFGRQAPGTSQEERAVAWRRFGLEFPVFDKIDVNGSQEHPIYRFLKSNQTQAVPFSSKSVYRGPDITWNFEKFLCDRNGVPVKRYKPAFDPLDLEDDLRLVLGGRGPTPPECAMHPGRIVCRADYDDLPPR